ncbi:MalY/PatB family protein [Celerinatantimonas diazotrophica]|uniref:cysteine-S-conjugate beta-lyase n=1 Tax=Celerinatantimonas diazotrophica TaxID=412034 RepID=A0A4R1K395_9GAMM|nr:PatB family C-S lyase [Celerinatantimonas diazotrophica]TCK58558.1 cystathionine beta-lyase [Celerinatantimonas diazotrophica]CAG9297187.1 Cystathionine beta-lyase PatB [Celerinatantimonas diazotrophica]
MQYDFDEMIDRENTNSVSVDGWRARIFKRHQHEHFPFDDIGYIRMWVADMDFATPEVVLDAIRDRLNKRILGYTQVYEQKYYDVLQSWFQRRYGVTIDTSKMVFSPGVVPALKQLVPLIMKDDESILISTPSYTPFKVAGDYNQRRVLYSALVNHNGYYEMDFADLEAKIADPQNHISLFILCNPHNPTGRVWSEEELTRLAQICVKYDIWIIADEIHCDLLRSGLQHHSMANIMPDYQKLILCTAPSKTFNLAGNLVSHIFIRDSSVLARWKNRYADMHSPLSVAAAQAAYEKGEDWLEALKRYLDDNLAFMAEFVQTKLPLAKFTKPEATYLAWVDLTAYQQRLGEAEGWAFFFAKNAGVVLEDGPMFVDNGQGFVRLNIACPRSVLGKALERMAEALID